MESRFPNCGGVWSKRTRPCSRRYANVMRRRRRANGEHMQRVPTSPWPSWSVIISLRNRFTVARPVGRGGGANSCAEKHAMRNVPPRMCLQFGEFHPAMGLNRERRCEIALTLVNVGQLNVFRPLQRHVSLSLLNKPEYRVALDCPQVSPPRPHQAGTPKTPARCCFIEFFSKCPHCPQCPHRKRQGSGSRRPRPHLSPP
ncbi:hypothetical protein SAMN05421783_14614 [Thiocapsa roseopersicina]|uniref:Uncharacterized protein n=1 Tax=Thiocapsa roseopersicina TaxID=1058 RepID=A0A1H3DC21_THIRO|nr:hypothetical protein SAMN05421783_14614 [Thiocapsa roseopersicina]